jgi:RNA polymerase sigma factor (sigma-70 family)
MQTDERLVAQIREGDDRAFEILFNRYQPRMLAYCRGMVGSPQDAEDVLQEVFEAAHAGILAHNRPIDARPWLYRIARNRSVNHLRRRRPDQGVDSMDVLPDEKGASPLERVEQREELRAIVTDVHELPRTQRTALVLREMNDLSYGDIARTMGKSLPSVKSLLIRARMSLAESSAARPALAPLGILALLRKLVPAKLGGGSGASGTLATSFGGTMGAKAAAGLATAALLGAGAAGVNEMSKPDGQPATARTGAAEATAPAATTQRSLPSAVDRPSTRSGPAGRRAAGSTADGPRSAARARSHGGGAASATRPPVEPALPGAPLTHPTPAEHVARSGRDIAQAATSTAHSVLAPVTSGVANASERVRDSIGHVTEGAVPPPRAAPRLRAVPPLRPGLGR